MKLNYLMVLLGTMMNLIAMEHERPPKRPEISETEELEFMQEEGRPAKFTRIEAPTELSLKQEQVAASIESLPNELLAYILPFLSSNLEIINVSLRQLREVNKRFKELIDDPKVTWDLIKFLAEKFKLSPFYIAGYLQIPSAQHKYYSVLAYNMKIRPDDSKDSRKTYIKFKLFKDHKNRYIIFALSRYPKNPKTYQRPNQILRFARLMPNGQIDPNFGQQGMSIFEVYPDQHSDYMFDYPPRIALAPDDSLFIAARAPAYFDTFLIGHFVEGKKDRLWPEPKINITDIYNIFQTKGIHIQNFIPNMRDAGFQHLYPLSIRINPDRSITIHIKIDSLAPAVLFEFDLILTPEGEINIDAIDPASIIVKERL